MRVLLLGGSGLLGRALVERLPRGWQCEAPTHAELDVTDAAAVVAWCERSDPRWIVNATGWTAVDAAESDESGARRLNVEAVAVLGAIAATRGCGILHYSSDYVFDGRSDRPYREDDETNPRSVYGRSKRDGELALLATTATLLIVRTQWLYGRGGRSFVNTMWERAQRRTAVRVVNDQYGAPTLVDDLASASWALVAAGATGIVHVTNRGATTWAAVARATFEAAGFPEGVTEVTSSEYLTPAERPRFALLDDSRLTQLLGAPMRPWEEALAEHLSARAAEGRS